MGVIRFYCKACGGCIKTDGNTRVAGESVHDAEHRSRCLKSRKQLRPEPPLCELNQNTNGLRILKTVTGISTPAQIRSLRFP